MLFGIILIAAVMNTDIFYLTELRLHLRDNIVNMENQWDQHVALYFNLNVS